MIPMHDEPVTDAGTVVPEPNYYQESGWRQDAACHPDRRPEGTTRAEWTATFFPERGARVSPAKRVCALCPVQAQCRAEAEELHEKDGIWGGATGRQRRRERALLNPPRRAPRYTDKDRERVRRLSAQGYEDAEVAATTGVSVRTIRHWRTKELSHAC
jgi:WhiB family redox-sensing transcriptional regulator